KEGVHPYVSCIILDRYGHILEDGNGEIIELTDTAGNAKSRLHAEARAVLRILSDDAVRRRAHTVITTLEPCSYRNVENHPEAVACAKLLSYSGIKQVIMGTLDPAAEISGRGAKILEQWEVYFNIFPQELHDLVIRKNEAYLKKNRYYQNSGRFYINPIDEYSINYAPKGVRDFFEKDKTFCEIWKQAGNDSGKFLEILFPDKNSTSLSESSEEIIDKLKAPAKSKKGYGRFSTFERISQYLGLSLDKDDGFRSYYVMYYAANWWIEKNGFNH
ncbi:MAG: hypothetical protein QXU18_10100, partial [Thermoplasmatales archaeon]